MRPKRGGSRHPAKSFRRRRTSGVASHRQRSETAAGSPIWDCVNEQVHAWWGCAVEKWMDRNGKGSDERCREGKSKDKRRGAALSVQWYCDIERVHYIGYICIPRSDIHSCHHSQPYHLTSTHTLSRYAQGAGWVGSGLVHHRGVLTECWKIE
jgi:hypothetical protein